MFKNTIYIVALIIFSAFSHTMLGQAAKLIVEEETIAPGTSQVEVDVTVEDFNEIAGVEFAVQYDSLIIRYAGLINVHPNLEGFSSGNVGVPGQGTLEEGYLTVSWDHFDENSPTFYSNIEIPDNEVFFTIQFDVVGVAGQTSPVNILYDIDDETGFNYFNADLEEFTGETDNGSVTIEGMTGNDTDLVAKGDTLNVASGATVCMPVTVRNFNDVQVGTGTFIYDTAVLEYVELANINGAFTPGLSVFATENEVRFSWVNNDIFNPVTLADGTMIFEVCFEAIGENGEMSVINLSEAGSLGFAWQDDDGNDIPSRTENGKINIAEGDPEFLTFTTASVQATMGSEVCVPVTVQNLEEVVTMQFSIEYDDDVLSFTEVTNDGVLMNMGSYNNNGNVLNFIYEGTPTGFSLADGTTIFEICFDAIGACNSESNIVIGSFDTPLEVSTVGSPDGIPNSEINLVNGTVDIICEAECSIVRIDQSCAGQQSGNVIVNVEAGCDCEWTDADGNVVSTDCNLIGVGAGTYELEVTCPGSQPGCTLTAEVTNFPAIGVSGDVTDASCNGLGSITVSTTASGNYTYTWSPDEGTSATINDLEPGDYTVTVTDVDTGCTESETFTVGTSDPEIIIDSETTDVSCNGDEDGSIELTVTGGCGDFSYDWSPDVSNTDTATDLAPGTYSVTVTDGEGNTASADIVVGEPDPLSIDGTPIIVASSGNDGSIRVNISGGTEPYSYDWTGASTNPNNPMISGLAPGQYSLLVTDANGCVFDTGVITVPDANSDFVINNIQVLKVKGNLAILCFGDRDAVITGDVSKGAFPVTISVSGPVNKTITVTEIGEFEIEDLAAGTYTLTAEDDEGNTINIPNIVINGPDALAIDYEKQCVEGNACDGEIELDVSGGVTSYSYEWSDTSLSGDSARDLCIGTYVVVVTDANGCEAMETIRLEDCNDPTGCYEGNKVVTPNGDAINDVFSISCIEGTDSALEIYDRWGQLVYSDVSYNNDWTGRSSDGARLDEGAYMWILSLDLGTETRIIKGTVTLLR